VSDQAAPAAFVDLHMHTTASDGLRAPSDVVRAAKAARLAAIAITDHDSVSGLAEAQIAGVAHGVRIVNGVELSAVEGEAETHLLGLHIRDVLVIDRELALLRDMRERRGQQIVKKLSAIGVLVTYDDVLQQAGGGAVGRPHVARALVADGWATDVRDAFDRYLGAGKPAYVAKDQLCMADAIAIIHSAGGLAVLAHPGGAGTRERLSALAELGLDGVEVKHPGHSPSDTSRLNSLTAQLGLLASGGSDWHGAADGPRTIGMMQVPFQWLALQDARLIALGHAPAA
jgi:predicted metal-dependent phosphoesterase TrpH